MLNGFYFKKITASGPNKKDAEIKFEKGLNVLTGPSDTGKSYILQCLNYMLGSLDPPKSIPEANGYNLMRAEMSTFDDQAYTLERKFANDYSDKYMMLYKPDAQTGQTTSQFLHVRYSKNQANVSSFLLGLLNLTEKNLISSEKYHDTKGLSFRDLARFCIVDETRITANKSPIYYDDLEDKTLNKSLFRFVLTGEDDDGASRIERPEITKSRINGMLEIVEEEIIRKQNSLEELNKQCEGFADEEVINQIERLVRIVENAYQQLEDEQRQKQELGNELNKLQAALQHDEALIRNFGLLRQHYLSDISRLDFMHEGKHALDELEEVNCPLCKSLIDKRILEPYVDNAPIIKDAIKEEHGKIKRKEADLSKAIIDLNEKIQEEKKTIEIKTKQFQEIDNLIASRLKPIHDREHGELAKYLRLKSAKEQINTLLFEIAENEKRILELKNKLAEKTPVLTTRIVPRDIYSELSDEIKKVLNSWGIDSKEVYYNEKDSDIVIDGLTRVNHGQGFRGLYLSAFMIGTLVYCLKNKKPHPHFLVLDTPLTAFKGKDKPNGNENEDVVPLEIQYRFYKAIEELPFLSQIQLIILEHEVPPLELLNKMHHERFTKDSMLGRYGFYP